MLPGHLRGALLTALVTILLPVSGFASPIESGAAFRPGPVSQDSLGAAAQEPSPSGPTIRAVRAPHPPTIDAVLDEPFWHEIEPVTDFRQRVPVDGATSSERTEFRVAFDDDYLYFAIVLHDTDPEGIRRSILHREGRIDQDDNIRIGLDTYHDRRNAYIFEINPFGTQDDALITDESMTLADWNWEGVYESQARITEDGWVVEAAVPFTTIRFADADAPVMGILMERTIRRKNEVVYFPHIGQEVRNALTQVSRYATLTGLEGLRRGRYMEVKPFAITGRSTAGSRDPQRSGPRREVLDHAQPYPGRHAQSRLRAGRVGQRPDQPHPLQPVLSREARILPGTGRAVRLRRRARDGSVLQPADRHRQRHRGGRPGDRTGGTRLGGGAQPLHRRRHRSGRENRAGGTQFGAAAARRSVPPNDRRGDRHLAGYGRRGQRGGGGRHADPLRRFQLRTGLGGPYFGVIRRGCDSHLDRGRPPQQCGSRAASWLPATTSSTVRSSASPPTTAAASRGARGSPWASSGAAPEPSWGAA